MRFKPFYIFVDEFWRFSTGRIIESLINECVKAGLHLCVANQETGQLSSDLLQAVLSMPNIMVFNVNMVDAKKLAPLFDGRVSVEDFLALGRGEAFGRLDSDITDFICPYSEDDNEKVRQKIISDNRKRYYTPLAEVRKKSVHKPKRRMFDSF